MLKGSLKDLCRTWAAAAFSQKSCEFFFASLRAFSKSELTAWHPAICDLLGTLVQPRQPRFSWKHRLSISVASMRTSQIPSVGSAARARSRPWQGPTRSRGAAEAPAQQGATPAGPDLQGLPEPIGHCELLDGTRVVEHLIGLPGAQGTQSASWGARQLSTLSAWPHDSHRAALPPCSHLRHADIYRHDN